MGVQFNPFTGQLDLTGPSGGGGGGSLNGVIPTDSINFQVVGDDVTGDVNLSADTASANNQLVNLTIESDGLKAQIPDANIQTASLNLQGPVTLTNNSSGNIFSYTAVGNNFTFVDYSILRNSNVRCGRLLIVTDGATVALSDAGYSELAPTGISLGVSISVGVVSLTYSASNIGSNGSFKYSLKQWS